MNPRLEPLEELENLSSDEDLSEEGSGLDWMGAAVVAEASGTLTSPDLSGVEGHLSDGRLSDASRLLDRLIAHARDRPRSEETHLGLLLSAKAVLDSLVRATHAKEEGDTQAASTHAAQSMAVLSRAGAIEGRLRELLSSQGSTFGVAVSSGDRDVQPPGTDTVQGASGYDPALGSALAQMSQRVNGGRRRSQKSCYKYVADAVDLVVGRFLSGRHAYMAASQLAARQDLFTEAPATSLTSLPAGAVVVWGKGTSESGHISIALGDGQESSDFVGPQMTSHYGGAAARVFLPRAKM
jgi:hypothetical protein